MTEINFSQQVEISLDHYKIRISLDEMFVDYLISRRLNQNKFKLRDDSWLSL